MKDMKSIFVSIVFCFIFCTASELKKKVFLNLKKTANEINEVKENSLVF